MRILTGVLMIMMMILPAIGRAETDEEYLDDYVGKVKQRRDAAVTTNAESKEYNKKSKTVTIITTTTQIQYIEEESGSETTGDDAVVITPKKSTIIEDTGDEDEVVISKKKPIVIESEDEEAVEMKQKYKKQQPEEFDMDLDVPVNIGTLVIGETLGVIVPGSGLAHFTMGDSTGGLITLTCTGVSILMYAGAEIAIHTRAIDNPNTYGLLHYGSMALFAAGYLFDIIGAPMYYFDNSHKNYMKGLDFRMDMPMYQSPQGLQMDVLNVNFEF